MAPFGVDIIGMKEIQDAFIRLGEGADKASKATVQEGTKMFLGDSKNGFEFAHSRGEPHKGGDKPNIVTGNLRRSILATPLEHVGMGEYRDTVSPTAIYARRVERGFEGPDTLGREYHQKPYPYMGPAAAKLQEKLPGIMAANWNKYVL